MWREPAEETDDIFDGLVVHDGRVTGSITIGHSRLPLWAIIGPLIHGGWEEVLEDWDYIEEDYEFTSNDLFRFLYNLMEMRGEFGRLLLTLAAAERNEQDAQDAAIAKAAAANHPGVMEDDGPGMIVDVTPGKADAVMMPLAWWQDPVLSAPVIEQLERCLAILKKEDLPE